MRAAAWQDIVCAFASALNALLEAFGGSSPLVTLIDDKCAIPTPNDPTNGN